MKKTEKVEVVPELKKINKNLVTHKDLNEVRSNKKDLVISETFISCSSLIVGSSIRDDDKKIIIC